MQCTTCLTCIADASSLPPLPPTQPRVVVLLIGTNDLSYLAKAKGGSASLEEKLAGAAPQVAHR